MNLDSFLLKSGRMIKVTISQNYLWMHYRLMTDRHYGKINISVPPPSPLKRKIWYYARAKKDQIKSAIENVDWPTSFSGLDVDDMTELFTSTSGNIFPL